MRDTLDSVDMKTGLFVPCLADRLYQPAAMATAELLDLLGIEFECPTRQTCCGQVAFNSGFIREAEKAARHFISVFSGFDRIICLSGSCVNMVRNHYPALFVKDPPWRKRALALSERIVELSEFLSRLRNITSLEIKREGTVTYHDSCHLRRGLGIFEQPRKLIRLAEKVKFVEMRNPDLCCGFGGAFSFKYPEISSSMVEEKVKNAVKSGADTIVCADIGCLLNIKGFVHKKRIPVSAIYIAEFLLS